MAHKINLVVIDMCQHLKVKFIINILLYLPIILILIYIFYFKDARNLFNTLEALYVHFSHPTRNVKLTDLQLKLNM